MGRADYWVAVHLVTESSDHSTHLINYDHVDDVVDELSDMFGDEFEYVQGIYVDAETFEQEAAIHKAIREAVDAAAN